MRRFGLILLSLSFLTDAETYTIGVTEQLAPYSKLSSSGQYQGINVDLAVALIDSIDSRHNTHFIQVPPVRLLWALDKKIADAVFINSDRTYLNNELLDNVICSNEIYNIDIVTYIRNDDHSSERHNKLSSLNEERIAILRGGIYENIKQIKNVSKFNAISSSVQLYTLLIKHRVDAVITEELSFVYHVRHLGDLSEVKLLDRVSSHGISFCVSVKGKLSKVDMSKINDKITLLNSNDELGNIFEDNLSRYINSGKGKIKDEIINAKPIIVTP